LCGWGPDQPRHHPRQHYQLQRNPTRRPDYPRYPTYGQPGVTEFRGDNVGADRSYWQIQFPYSVNVSNFWMEVNESPYHTTSVRLDTSMDGVNWATQTTAVGNTDAQIDGSFLPVQAKYVRITSLASNDPLYPNIIRAVRLRGP